MNPLYSHSQLLGKNPKFLSRKNLSRKYRSIFASKNQSCDRRDENSKKGIVMISFLEFGRSTIVPRPNCSQRLEIHWTWLYRVAHGTPQW